jgi:hypothetical protein
MRRLRVPRAIPPRFCREPRPCLGLYPKNAHVGAFSREFGAEFGPVLGPAGGELGKQGTQRLQGGLQMDAPGAKWRAAFLGRRPISAREQQLAHAAFGKSG